ncbi:MAG: DUF2267 domain-containing protein [Actinobacteria bacterium]|nr:MAG: DUF2267 domain-containing protein [Actinomycetota bacterium]
MNYDEFIEEVRERGHMGSREEAEKATRATLRPLAERLRGGEAKDLASQLPPEIAEHLEHERAGAGESFSLDEFFERVCERDEGVDLPRAVYHARVVVDVLGEAITRGEIEDVRSQLPAEYGPLFKAGSQGEMDT